MSPYTTGSVSHKLNSTQLNKTLNRPEVKEPEDEVVSSDGAAALAVLEYLPDDLRVCGGCALGFEVNKRKLPQFLYRYLSRCHLYGT